MSLSIRRAGVPRFLDPAIDPRRAWRQGTHEGKIFLYGQYFGGWFDLSGAAGLLALSREGWAGLRVPLEIFLCAYCAWRAIDHGGFLLHGASLVRDGKAYVFFGHSGAGKTTVSALGAENTFVLSDDLTLITLEREGYRAHTVPFRRGGPCTGLAERRTYPLAGLYRLVQAPHERLQRLPHQEAVATVLSCLPFVTDPAMPRDPAQMLALLDRALRDLPVFRLEFTRSAGFWEPVLQSVR